MAASTSEDKEEGASVKEKPKKNANVVARQNPYHHRVNFLYQATKYFADKTDAGSQEISNFYARTMNEVQQKSLAKVDPTIKQTVCRKCHQYLASPSNCRQRWKSSKNNSRSTLIVTCKKCNRIKRFVTKTAKKTKIVSKKP